MDWARRKLLPVLDSLKYDRPREVVRKPSPVAGDSLLMVGGTTKTPDASTSQNESVLMSLDINTMNRTVGKSQRKSSMKEPPAKSARSVKTSSRSKSIAVVVHDCQRNHATKAGNSRVSRPRSVSSRHSKEPSLSSHSSSTGRISTRAKSKKAASQPLSNGLSSFIDLTTKTTSTKKKSSDIEVIDLTNGLSGFVASASATASSKATTNKLAPLQSGLSSFLDQDTKISRAVRQSKDARNVDKGRSVSWKKASSDESSTGREKEPPKAKSSKKTTTSTTGRAIVKVSKRRGHKSVASDKEMGGRRSHHLQGQQNDASPVNDKLKDAPVQRAEKRPFLSPGITRKRVVDRKTPNDKAQSTETKNNNLWSTEAVFDEELVDDPPVDALVVSSSRLAMECSPLDLGSPNMDDCDENDDIPAFCDENEGAGEPMGTGLPTEIEAVVPSSAPETSDIKAKSASYDPLGDSVAFFLGDDGLSVMVLKDRRSIGSELSSNFGSPVAKRASEDVPLSTLVIRHEAVNASADVGSLKARGQGPCDDGEMEQNECDSRHTRRSRRDRAEPDRFADQKEKQPKRSKSKQRASRRRQGKPEKETTAKKASTKRAGKAQGASNSKVSSLPSRDDSPNSSDENKEETSSGAKAGSPEQQCDASHSASESEVPKTKTSETRDESESKTGRPRRERAKPNRFGQYVSHSSAGDSPTTTLDEDKVPSQPAKSKQKEVKPTEVDSGAPARKSQRDKKEPNRFGQYADLSDDDKSPVQSKASYDPPVERKGRFVQRPWPLPRYNEDMAEISEDGWSAAQVVELKEARHKVDPSSPSFWDNVASLVTEKSAEECREKWFSMAATPIPKKKGKTKEKVAVVKTADEDDFFDSTPMRLAAESDDTTNENSTIDFGSAFKRYCAKKKDASDSDDDSISRPEYLVGDDLKFRPLDGYQTYLQAMRRNVAGAQKERKKKKPKAITDKRGKAIAETIVTADGTEITARLSIGGTLKVKNGELAEDDFWGETTYFGTQGEEDDGEEDDASV